MIRQKQSEEPITAKQSWMTELGWWTSARHSTMRWVRPEIRGRHSRTKIESPKSFTIPLLLYQPLNVIFAFTTTHTISLHSHHLGSYIEHYRASNPSAATMSKSFSTSDVAEHTSADKGMYIIVDEGVYDVTSMSHFVLLLLVYCTPLSLNPKDGRIQ